MNLNEIKTTPLHLAVKNKSIQIIKLLLQNKNIDVNAMDKIIIFNYIKLRRSFNDFFLTLLEKTN